jgi:hypothetical protein
MYREQTKCVNCRTSLLKNTKCTAPDCALVTRLCSLIQERSKSVVYQVCEQRWISGWKTSVTADNRTVALL